MMSNHCGQSMVTISDNRLYFKKRCLKCSKTFKQHKRLPKCSVCGQTTAAGLYRNSQPVCRTCAR